MQWQPICLDVLRFLAVLGMIYAGIAMTSVLRTRSRMMFSEDADTRCLRIGFLLASLSGLILAVPLARSWLVAGSPPSARMNLIMATTAIAAMVAGCGGALLVAKAVPGFLAKDLGGPADSGL